MKLNLVLPVAFATATCPLSAQLVGTEPFTYTNGSIANQAGGTGFNYDNFDKAVTAFSSDWDNVFNAPTVVGNALTTSNSGAKREYNGTIEGAGDGANDGQDNHERSGAVRGTGRVFYRFTVTRGAGATWCGASSYDFGTERVLFGVPSSNGPTTGGLEFGCSGNGATYYSGIPADNATHTIVTVLDFDRDFIGMWVDPTADDYYDLTDGSNSSDAGGIYTPGNWSTAVRLASGSGGTTTWDDISVALDPLSVGLKNATDADGDGLPGSWEVANGLDDSDDGTIGETSPGAKNGPNGAAGDPDGDTVGNLIEFQDGTSPTLADTDADQLSDGEEKTAGTNPLLQDTDGDLLNDGDEVHIHSTNPNLVDSDSGGTSDSTEIAVGTQPGSPGDDPATNGNVELVGLDYFDSYFDGSLGGQMAGVGWDYDNSALVETFIGHTTTKSSWQNVFGAAVQVQAGSILTQNNGIRRPFHGGTANATAAIGERTGAWKEDAAATGANGSNVFYVKVNLIRQPGAAWGGVSLYDFGIERVFIGVSGTANPSSGVLEFAIEQSVGGTRVFTGVAPTANTSYTLVAKCDFATSTIRLWLNPNLAAPEASSTIGATLNVTPAQMNATALRLASGGTGATIWDQLVVGTSWASLSSLPSDTDGDGMPDDFEDLYGFDKNVNDADLDADLDGISNLAEYQAGTNPTNDDTDGDGLTDDKEALAGSSPLNPDTDGDGLSDGAEVNTHHTSPILVDTDGDGQSDGGEIAGLSGFTSDPLDPNDTIGAPIGLIGTEDFTYADGAVAGLVGGTYFDYENWLLNGPFVGHTSTTSDWDGTATVAGGRLVTRETFAYRDFNGPSEGAGSDQAPTDARMGAVNEGGSHSASVVYFKAEMTRRGGAALSLFGPDDFNAERLAFGIVENGSVPQWGIREGAAITADGGALPIIPDQTYTVVGKLDFPGNLLSLWINPNLNGTELSNPPHVTRVYNAGNWASGVRFTSTGTGDTEWDNLVVANNWAHLAGSTPLQLGLSISNYSPINGTISINANGIPAGQTFHLRSSGNLQSFIPLVPPFNFDSTTPQPFVIPVNPTLNTKLFFRAEEGPSPE